MVTFDEFGPEKIIEVYNPKVGMHGFVVIDNASLGPGKGGIRMTPTVTITEVVRLARSMTLKNALAELPFGGAKAGIIADSKHISLEKKRSIVRAFSKALKIVSPSLYVAAPDMNMGEQDMVWFAQGNGDKKSCTGKPVRMGGLPHELGGTGYGVFLATEVAANLLRLKIKNSTVAVEGFGNVGMFAAKYLSEAGAKLIAVSDSHGVICNKDGLDYNKLVEVKEDTGTVTKYPQGDHKCCSSILDVNADILVTAAIPDLIKSHDVPNLKFKLIVEGSNIPMTFDVERKVHEHGILVVPDIVANAGGVISSYVEYIGGNEKKMFEMINKKIIKNTKEVLTNSKKRRCMPRKVALELAFNRFKNKCEICKV